MSNAQAVQSGENSEVEVAGKMTLPYASRVAGLFLVAAALSLAGCGKSDAPAAGGAGAPGGGPGGGKAGGGSKKFPVRVAEVQTQPVQYEIQAVGNLVEANRYEIPARVAGVAQNVNFNEGDEVTTGQELARIDYDRYKLMVERARNDAEQDKAAVARAQASLADRVRDTSNTLVRAKVDFDLAQAELERRNARGVRAFTSEEERKQFEGRYLQAQADYHNAQLRVETQRALAEAEVDSARTAYASSLAALRIAEDDLKNAIIRAPVQGQIQQRMVTDGQYLMVGTTTAMMVQTDPLRLRFTVPESRSANLTRDMQVKFRVPAYPQEEFVANVYDIGSLADPQTRQVQGWAWVPNAERKLRAGYFTTVSIVEDSKNKAVVVPLASVLPTEFGMVAFVIQDGIAVRRKVETGLQVTGEAIEILSGLEPGEQLVVEGMESLQENVPVEILPRVVPTPATSVAGAAVSTNTAPTRPREGGA